MHRRYESRAAGAGVRGAVVEVYDAGAAVEWEVESGAGGGECEFEE